MTKFKSEKKPPRTTLKRSIIILIGNILGMYLISFMGLGVKVSDFDDILINIFFVYSEENLGELEVINPLFERFIFTIKAVLYFKKYIKKEKLENVVIYVLGSKVGPLFSFIEKSFKKMNVKIAFNPDGLEWQREKWAWWIKQCFKISERTMIKHSDYIVCDSKNIENYVKTKYEKYGKPTTFIEPLITSSKS